EKVVPAGSAMLYGAKSGTLRVDDRLVSATAGPPTADHEYVMGPPAMFDTVKSVRTVTPVVPSPGATSCGRDGIEIVTVDPVAPACHPKYVESTLPTYV